MSCTPDPVIPMLDCCQPQLCFDAYQVYAERDLFNYYRSIEPDGTIRFWLSSRSFCGPFIANPPTFPITRTINRYDYSITLDQPTTAPYGLCDVEELTGMLAVGGYDVYVQQGGPRPTDRDAYLTNEISISDIFADLETLLAVPFPIPGEHPKIFLDGTALTTVPPLSNFRRTKAVTFRIWSEFNSAGVPIRSARGYTRNGIPDAQNVGGSTLGVGNCWWAGRRIWPFKEFIAAQKMRINVQGQYCIADDVARSCQSFDTGSAWTQIDILPPDIPQQLLTYSEGNRYLDTGCLCPFT